MQISFFLLLAVSLLYCITAEQQAPSSTSTNDPSTSPTSKYSIVSKLLGAVDGKHFSTNLTQQTLVIEIKKQIVHLSRALHTEEEKLMASVAKRDSKKQGFFWMFDTEKRLAVEGVQLEVNDQTRIVENLHDDINFHWRQLKPLYGVFSEMFMLEMLSIVPFLVSRGAEMLTSTLELGLISLLIFGPVSIFSFSFFMAVGFAFLPFFIFVLSLYWVFTLPFTIIEYSPTIAEFAGVYFAILAAFWIIFSITLIPVRRRRTTTHEVRPAIIGRNNTATPTSRMKNE